MMASRLLGGAPLYLAVVDAAAPAVALIVFALAALAAALLPAIRAIHQNPIEALRHE
jgi:ABC-type antimicrobial peptide transport system permease subunit